MVKYASFLFPINLRRTRAPHLWAFLCQLERINSESIVYIGSEEYFSNEISRENRWEWERWSEGARRRAYLKNKLCVPKSLILGSIYKGEKLDNRAWRRLVMDEIPELVDYLVEVLSQYPFIQVVLTLCNCKSLSVAASKLGIKIAYFELGALRSPNYIETAYFDFKGVNGFTSSEADYASFKKKSKELSLLNREELFNFVCKRYVFEELKLFKSRYKLGVPLQVEDDSNMLFYANGFNNFELLAHANSLDSKFLVRKHPLGHATYNEKCCVDKSPNSLEFVCKCDEILTINSSVGFEALLVGKRVTMVGDNPVSFFVNNRELDESSVVLFLNFFVFRYLVPFDLLFDESYMDWRLTSPSDESVYEYNKKYYEKQFLNNETKIGKKEKLRRAFLKLFSF